MLTAVTPTIRASDLYCSCPYLYLLRRRYGIVPFFEPSIALSRGSWAHKYLELLLAHHGTNFSLDPSYSHALSVRLAELSAACTDASLPPQVTDKWLANEVKNAQTAFGFMRASLQFRAPALHNLTWSDYIFGKYNLTPVGVELLLTVEWMGMPLTAQFDALLLNPATKKLWVLDLKTCDCPATQRLSLVGLDWQTRHYLRVLQLACAEGSTITLPDGTPLAKYTCGGMIHVAIQKPSIEPSAQKDRPLSLINESKRTNRKGTLMQVSPTQFRATIISTEDGTIIYEGTKSTIEDATAYLELEVGTKLKPSPVEEGARPDPILYSKRCEDWYNGSGDYLHEADFRRDPRHLPVNISTTPIDCIQPNTREDIEYRKALQAVNTLRTADPSSEAVFSRNPSSLLDYGRPSRYAPFFFTVPVQWPEVMRQEGFVIHHRNDVPTTPSQG